MRQEIYEDEHGINAWDTSTGSRCFVHIVNSVQLLHLTGCQPPSKPPTAQNYTNAGLPWYDYYGGDLKALEGAKELAELDSVASVKLKKGEGFLPDNDPVNAGGSEEIEPNVMVREGQFLRQAGRYSLNSCLSNLTTFVLPCSLGVPDTVGQLGRSMNMATVT